MNNKLRVKRIRATDYLMDTGYLESHNTRTKEVANALRDIAEETGINVSSLAQVCDCMVIDGKYEYHNALEALASLFKTKN